MTTVHKGHLALIATMSLFYGALASYHGLPYWASIPGAAFLGYALGEIWPLYQVVVNEE